MERRLKAAIEQFSPVFGDTRKLLVARAPGRVNLIGEHTDYNDGYVLPCAIDRDIIVVCRPNGSGSVRLWSVDFEKKSEFSLDLITHDTENPWTNYARGVAQCLQNQGVSLCGVDAVVQGNVPIGAGLSSSAAMEVAFAYAFLAASSQEMNRLEIVKLCQRAENNFVGVNCGIMDQFVSVFGEAQQAVFIDCRSLDHKLISLGNSNVKVVVFDTRVKRELTASEYNARRVECEEAVKILSGKLTDIRALRDVDEETLAEYSTLLPDSVYRRARHVVAENQRVLHSLTALERGDIHHFGVLLQESHESLKKDFEVSCKELDVAVEIARVLEGVHGSRMTGAGFGGCTVNLVASESADHFCRQLCEQYEERTGTEGEAYICEPARGACVEEIQ